MNTKNVLKLKVVFVSHSFSTENISYHIMFKNTGGM